MSKVVLIVACLFSGAAYSSCKGLVGSTVRLIVPNTTGSTYDVYARTLRPTLQTTLGTDIYIDNVSGGGGIVAARTVASAIPDGTTISIMNGAGIISAGLAGRANVPDFTKDLQILGRASPMQHVWAVASDSNLHSISELRQAAERSPIVLGVRNIASTSFASLAVGAHLLRLHHVFVSGYASNRDTRLAIMRGELDLVSMDLSSGARLLTQGSLRAVLQMSDRNFDSPIDVSDVETLADHIPMTQDALNERGKIARVMVGLLRLNRLFVAPAGLNSELHECLQSGIAAALREPTVVAALEQRASSVEFVDGPTVQNELQEVVSSLPLIEPIVRAATKRLR